MMMEDFSTAQHHQAFMSLDSLLECRQSASHTSQYLSLITGHAQELLTLLLIFLTLI